MLLSFKNIYDTNRKKVIILLKGKQFEWKSTGYCAMQRLY